MFHYFIVIHHTSNHQVNQSVLIKLYLETGVDVVPKLAAQVHARPHRWTLRLNIPEGGRGQDAGGGNVLEHFRLNIAL